MNRVPFVSAPDSVPGDVALPPRGTHAAGFPGRVSVNVLCVDDNPTFRAVLRTLVSSTPGFVQIGEAAWGEDAIAAVDAVRTDLVLMDVRMPGIGGFNAAATMVERHPKLVVVLLSASQIEPPLPLARLGPGVTFVAKGELSPKRLLDLWSQRRKFSGH